MSEEQPKPTYAYEIRCYNCGHGINLTIPKGTTVHRFLASPVRKKEHPIVCDNCGVGTRE